MVAWTPAPTAGRMVARTETASAARGVLRAAVGETEALDLDVVVLLADVGGDDQQVQPDVPRLLAAVRCLLGLRVLEGASGSGPEVFEHPCIGEGGGAQRDRSADGRGQ